MTKGDHDQSANKKCLTYIAGFVIAKTIIILVFVLLVMRVRNLKLRLDRVTVETLNVNNSSSSFTAKLNAQVIIKNTNFGEFRFQNSTATFSYEGKIIGEGTIVKAHAKLRSTKKVNVTVTVNSNKLSKNSRLASDVDSGIVSLSSHAELHGKVYLFKIFKKKKSAEMNCAMDINITMKEVQNLVCK